MSCLSSIVSCVRVGLDLGMVVFVGVGLDAVFWFFSGFDAFCSGILVLEYLFWNTCLGGKGRGRDGR